MKAIKHLFTIVLTLAAATLAATAQENDISVHFTPKEGAIKTAQTFKIVFPDAMVAADAVGREAAGVLDFEPKLKGTFRWNSQTEGTFQITDPVVPGAQYGVQLKKNVKTLDGRKLRRDAISGSYESAAFKVTPKFRSRGKNLPAAPTVRLLFNYGIEYRSAAKAVYFQDRDTRERFAAAILIPGIQTRDGEPLPEAPKTGSDISVEPEAPLPVGRKIDLIIEGLRDAATNTPIPFLKSIPLGETHPLRVDRIEAFGSAKFEPTITVYLSSEVDADTLAESTVSISPDVPNLRRLSSGHSIQLLGDFDLTGDYTVTVSPPLSSTTGYGMTDPFAKTISFDGYNPEIWFPSQLFFQRSALGLNVKFLHANTKQVFWKLAQIPDHQIAIVRSRLSNEKELAADSLGLKAVASGELPGTSTIEAAYHDIRWKPAEGEPMLSGAYLLEVNTPLRSGKLAGHRALIFFNDLMITQKRLPSEVLFKITRMADSAPVADAKVRAVRADNELRAAGTTDADGIVRFPSQTLFPTKQEDASHLLVDTPEGRAIQFISVPRFRNTPGYWSDKLTAQRGVIISDRNLYRPGTTVKFKGIVRSYPNGGRLENQPEPMADRQIRWKIEEGNGGKTVAGGTARTDEYGGWESQWKTPADQNLGRYSIRAEISGALTVGYNSFRIEEYRTPLFNVSVSDDSKPGSETTRIRLQSNYFHGSPNAGARVEWNVGWGTTPLIWDEFERDDDNSENPLPEPIIDSASGELRLNADGSGFIELPLPVRKPLFAPGLTYSVSVDVTSPEGRTISTGLYEARAVVPLLPAVRAHPVYKENEPTFVEVELRANNTAEKNAEVADVPMTVEMFHVVSQTVKEKIAPGVYRYRNFDRYEISAIEKGFTGKTLRLPASNPGRYAVVASLDGQPDAPRVSEGVSVAADAPAQYPVQTSMTFSLKPDKDIYQIGETAVLASESPFPGKAWVSVETYGVHDQFVVDVPANASQITIPIKPEYHPNVYVSVYIVQPGGADHLPVERMGVVHLNIDRPELELKVVPTLTKDEVEPGKPVNGFVLVTTGGKPLANADVTVMAVDEAVLKLGGWGMEDLIRTFFPHRYHRVSTYQALHNHHEDFDESEMVEKGFLIGGGGGGAAGFSQQKMRKNFLARAFWKTQLRTDASGKVAFDFEAPDNLTAFRVTAIANSKESQFGHGQATLRVAKRLMAEAALPRFVRLGDELELRVVVRQTAVEKGVVLVKCQTEGGIKISGEGVADPAEVLDGIPRVFRFPAVVTSTRPSVVRFSAELDGQPDIGDAVETKLPVYLPGILQSTGRYGEIPAGANGFKLTEHVPEFWQHTSGSFNLTLSHNPWLPKLTGLPNILEYPHGCLEQKSTKYLGYTVLADLLNFLPDLQGRHENYSAIIADGLKLYEANLRDGKFLPYWPGTHEKNYYVTVLAAWVTHNADKAGITVSDRLKDGFRKGLEDIIRGRTDAGHNTRCFALFVHSEMTKDFKNPNPNADVMSDLYLHRDRSDDESRSLLAIAMLNFGVLEEERAQLIREINMPLKERAFDPSCFYSTTRAEAMRFVAQSRAGGEDWGKGGAIARERLLKLMESSYRLSTQENLWLLIAFKELHDRKEFAQFDPEKIQPSAEQVSKNQVSVAWKTRALDKLKDMVVSFENTQPAYYLVDAKVMRSGENMEREDRGIRIERVVHNLTDSKRLGTKEAPFKLGDEILVNYRMSVKNVQHFTALVDELPAAVETLNPNLAQVAEFYELPKEFDKQTLWLNHSELKDQAANLYFDHVEPGQHSYSILARITSVGRFTWPSASMTPMYETRFGGLTAPNECHVTE